MEEAKALIRTSVRTFYPAPKQVLLVDALLQHGVLHLDDFSTLSGLPPKELRGHLQPLRSARFLTTHSKKELNLSQNREVNREYYYCRFSDAVNAIKFRIATLRRNIENSYQKTEGREFWNCPRCGSKWKEMDILPNADHQMLCPRCGAEVNIDDHAAEDKDSHETIMRLNSQLSKFNALIAAIDSKISSGQFREPKFDDAFARRKIVPEELGGKKAGNFVEVRRNRERDKAAGAVNENDIQINITSASALSREEAEREVERRRKLQENNQLPDWMRGGAIKGNSMDIKTEEAAAAAAAAAAGQTGAVGPPDPSALQVGVKSEPADEKKPDLVASAATKQDPTQTAQERAEQAMMEQYMLDMQREQAEAERRRQEEDDYDEDEDGEEDDDDEFEDVPGTGVPTSAVGTPASSSQGGLDGRAGLLGTPTSVSAAAFAANGTKRDRDREFEDDSSEAATPASDERDPKRVRVGLGSDANGARAGGPSTAATTTAAGAATAGADDSDDEEFEDV